MGKIEPANAFTAKKGRLKDGVTRAPGLTFQDIRQNDPNPGPDEIFKEHTVAGDKFSVPNSWYFSDEIAALEKEKLWSNSWIFACRVERIPSVGSCYVHSFLDHSVLVVRTGESEFKAFRNTCTHRGNALREKGSCGVINKFWCPFHGATWNLDGSVRTWPYEYDFPHLEEGDYSLGKVHIEEFKGFLFVNMAEEPTPFEEFIAPLPEYTVSVPSQNWFPTAHMRKRLHCNWKLARQAFQESIHTPVVHPQAIDIVVAAGAQIDSLGKFVRRLITPAMVASDTKDRVKNEKELIATALKMLGTEPDQSFIDGLDDDIRARDFIAGMTIEQFKQAAGIDISGLPTSQIVDNVVYYLFPSFHMHVSVTAPFCMFFTPGSTPDDCYFDMIWFAEGPEGMPKPEYPDIVHVPDGDTWDEHRPKDLVTAVGPDVLDQDTDNMEGQQRGVRAAPDGVSIFANYSEAAIINDMKLLKEILEL